ncbi:MAG: ABC transporter substrate-binding protein [Saprospiraceae bacterium]|nr:ABC transporter substrate-binding protein [Saprospiraceae bacterium]
MMQQVRNILLLIILSLISCKQQPKSIEVIHSNSIEIKDFFNRTIILPPFVNKIVPLYYSECEILTALGAKNKIVGVGLPYNSSTPDYFPILKDFAPEIFKLPQVGASGNVNLESLFKIKPDLVLSDNNILTINQIENYFKIISIFPHRYSDIFDHIKTIGKIVGKNSEAKILSDTLTHMLTKVKAIANNISLIDYKKLYYVRSDLLTTLNDSIHNEIFNICGGHNILEKDFPNSFSFQISIELLLKHNPDIIVIRDRSNLNVNDILNDRRLIHLKAVKNKNIFKEHNAWKEYRLESIFGIIEKAKWFHPKEFASLNPNKEYEMFLNLIKKNNEAASK